MITITNALKILVYKTMMYGALLKAVGNVEEVSKLLFNVTLFATLDFCDRNLNTYEDFVGCIQKAAGYFPILNSVIFPDATVESLSSSDKLSLVGDDYILSLTISYENDKALQKLPSLLKCNKKYLMSENQITPENDHFEITVQDVEESTVLSVLGKIINTAYLKSFFRAEPNSNVLLGSTNPKLPSFSIFNLPEPKGDTIMLELRNSVPALALQVYDFFYTRYKEIVFFAGRESLEHLSFKPYPGSDKEGYIVTRKIIK